MPVQIKELLQSDPEQLLEELDRLREKEKLIGYERELVERVLEMILEGGGPAAEWLNDPARGLLTIGSLRSQILRVIDAGSADIAWQPREVYEQLVAHGNNKVSLDNVRSTMGRMVASGELIQPEPPLAAFMRPSADSPPGEAKNDI
ncbi:MAG TPA: hypothetical protein VGL54_08870 [Solirubrobacteraceae bacterium]|jgi:hypothetical protein